MSSIEFSPCMALDAICFIQKSSLSLDEDNFVKYMMKNQIEEIDTLNSQLPNDFAENGMSMSTVSLILSVATDNDIDNYSLDDLIKLFSDTNSLATTVKSKIKNSFTVSYVYHTLDLLINEYAQKYIEKLKLLKSINFEQQYNQRIMPLVRAEIEKNQQNMCKYDFAELLQRISMLKCSNTANNIKIFVSFFSAPTAFTLYNSSFLTCFSIYPIDFYTLSAHELMHGFADKELTEMYVNYVSSNDYLKEMHRRLIEDMCSGDEEEFTMAAEYYLCLLSGKYESKELFDKLKQVYDGCCPTAVMIFELLSKEKNVPTDYCSWLKRQFINQKLPTDNIEKYIMSFN